MNNDQALQDDVLKALRWEPILDGAQIGVTVDNGIVTLTGTVDSHSIKSAAENSAKNVAGVKAVVEKIEIRIFSTLVPPNDNQIASDVVNALMKVEEIPAHTVSVRVENGWVTLEGILPLHCQKETVQEAIKNFVGIRGLTNNIVIKVETQDDIGKKQLEDTFRRNASLDERRIKIDVSGTTITLSGTVISAYQKSEAGRVAWNTPGVKHIVNDIRIVYDHNFVD